MTTPNVTEFEMREFFNRLISTIVEGTRTHEQLTALEQRFKQTEERVQSLISELSQTRSELYTTVVERDKARKEAQENKDLAESYANDLARVRDEVTVLDNNLRHLGTQLADTGRELEQTKVRLQAAEGQATHLQEERTYWRDRANTAEATGQEVRSAYESLNKKWQSMADFFKPVEMVAPLASPEPTPSAPVPSYTSPEPSPGEEHKEEPKQTASTIWPQF